MKIEFLSTLAVIAPDPPARPRSHVKWMLLPRERSSGADTR
jgi:hypothetical protein